MSIKWFGSKSKLEPPPVIVAVGLTPRETGQLNAIAAAAHIAVSTTAPTDREYVVVLGKDAAIPGSVPTHIPVLHFDAPELARHLDEALLYLEAHQRIRR